MEEKEQALLVEMSKIIAEGATSVLPMLIPKPVKVNEGKISEWEPTAYPEAMFLVTASFSEGPSGSVYLLLASKNAAVLADLMLGGEGSEERSLDEEAKGALKEAMNQLLGVTATGMRERYEVPVGFAQVDVHGLEPGIDLNLLLGDDPVFRIDFDLKIDEKEAGTFSYCLPKDTFETLETALQEGGGEPAAEPEAPAAAEPVAVAAAPQPQVSQPTVEEAEREPGNVNLILEIEMPIIIRLGSAEMTLHEVLGLGPGAIIELNKTVDEPVELLVNNKVLAMGEVVVVEGNFAFRVTEVISKSARIKSLA